MAVKERPILFSGEMVRAILEGRKTQTRRVIKPQPQENWVDWLFKHHGNRIFDRNGEPQLWLCGDDGKEIKFPYGKPGDRLWVRETWGIYSESWTDYGWEGDGIIDIPIPKQRPLGTMHSKRHVVYRADGYETDGGEQWRPSIFMPRWASRILLEITEVRVQRLFDISQEDAKAEGVSIEATRTLTHVGAFAITWDAINKKRGYGWEGGTNPWVWAISFRRITP